MKLTRQQFDVYFQSMNASWAYEDAALSDAEKELLYMRLIDEISDEQYNASILGQNGKKGLGSMTDAELDLILAKATQHAREKAKAAGTSLVYELHGKMIREYADGTKTEIVRDCQGEQKEIEYNEPL